ncbi:hypothetical protein VNO80_08283 [Phaseolus coccineus]|uniref:Uncharacterized protein n=1 Tax=Phaseolus coccineus TaxID=3886 RepID=A0AAN9RG32_PHACN
MFRRYGPPEYKHMLLSDSETESDDNLSNVAVTVAATLAEDGRREREEEGNKTLSTHQHATSFKSKQTLDPEALLELAKEYQTKMENKDIPRDGVKEMMVVNWKGLAKTLKTLYGQPLHYLTQKLCNEWDKSRFGSDNEEKPLSAIFSWREAVDTIWRVEAVHRLCTSPVHLAVLWLDDPEYRVIVNEVISTPSVPTP